VSSDDLRINLWNVEVNKEVFEIVDIKPENMELLSEIITFSSLHPRNCNLLTFGTNKGLVKLCDFRQKALCSQFNRYEDVNSDIGGFFKEVINNVTYVDFSPNGQFIVSRDYLTMKIWDTRTEKSPLRVIKFQDHLISKLCDLYENERLFDKFDCAWDWNSSQLLTGSYNSAIYISDGFGSQIKSITATKPGTKVKNQKKIDYASAVAHTAWHPKQDIIAVGARDFGFLYIRK